jgi:hypothetical protein
MPRGIYERSQKEKERHREWVMNHPECSINNPEYRKMGPDKLRGTKLSPERCAQISASGMGHPVSQETRSKISTKKKGRPRPDMVGNKINWKGGRTVDSKGYVKTMNREHPCADKSGYVFEHRLVMEKILGRYLTSGEHVHHLNGVKDDNRKENLAVLVVSGPHYGWVMCPHCQKGFLIR